MTSLRRVLFDTDRRFAAVALAALCVAAGLVAGAYAAILSPVYALAGALAVTAGLLMLRSVAWSFAALIGLTCLLPFGALPFKIGFTPTFLDIALICLYVVWLLRIATGKEADLLAGPLGLPVAIFMLLACASFVAGMGHSALNQYVVRHFAELLLSIGLLFVVLNTVRTPEQLRTLVRLVMLAGFAAALIGVALYYLPESTSIRLLSALGRFGYPTGAGVLRYVEDDPAQALRAISTSTDPNVLGGLLILVGTLTAAQLFSPRPVLRRWMLGGMALVDALCLYLTFSRGSMAGFAVGLGALALARYRRLIPAMAVAGLLLLLLPQTQEYVQHFIEGLQRQDLATQMRLGEYKDALLLIGRHPWIGVGFISTPEASLYIGVSNVYLLIAEEMGFVGLGAFLLVLVLFFREARRGWAAIDHGSELAGILLGLAAAVAGMLVGGIFDHYFFNLDFPHSVAVFWLYVGLTMAATRMGRAGQERARGPVLRRA
ncbi:MAG TPA: O-antigen ligase family protein [Anaerolineae bacterium]|nr:O-antigen ligase family protein [Anaerolineae bacterium]